MENAGDAGIFVHAPIFEDLHNGKRVDDVGVARFAKLALVGFGGKLNRFIHDIIIS